MRGKFLSVSLNSLRNVIFAKEKRLAPTCSSRFALILPFALFAALAVVSCGGGGNPPPAQFPVANAGGPYFTNVGQSLGFDGSQSTAPTGQSLTYAWDFGDGGTATGVKPAHTYMNSGNFTVKLTVTDTGGATNSASVPVVVVPLPVSNPGGPYSGKVNQAITFNGSASTVPPGQNASYSWNFGDNSTGTGAMPMHAYSTTGVFTVTLTVRDDTGGVGTNTTTATITSGPSAFPLAAKNFLAIRPGEPSFAYVAELAADGKTTLSANSVDASNGTLSAFQNMNLDSLQPAAGFDLRGIALDPLFRFLYVVGRDSLLSFVIDSASGALTQQNSTVLIGSVIPEGGHLFVMHPSGKFGYLSTETSNQVGQTDSSAISVFSVDQSSGALTMKDSVPALIPNPNFTVIDPTGEYLFVSGSESGDSNAASTIGVFAIDSATGNLIAASPTPKIFSARMHVNAMVADALGQFIYAVGSSLDSGQAVLSLFSIDRKSGTLSEVPGSPFPLDYDVGAAISVTIDPMGKKALVLTTAALNESYAQESIQILSLEAFTGVPTPLANVPITQIPLDRHSAIGSVTILGDRLSLCGVADTPPQTCDPSTSLNPSLEEASSHATFIYVISPGDAGISVFSMDPKTGLVSPAPARISTPMKMPIALTPH